MIKTKSSADRFSRFADFKHLEAKVGRTLADKALSQLDGLASIAGGVVTLKGYGVYLDSESIVHDFPVRNKLAKPRLKDISLEESEQRRICEHLTGCFHRTKRGLEKSIRQYVLSGRKDKLKRKIESWKFEKDWRAGDLKQLRAALRQFRKFGILLVRLDNNELFPNMRTSRPEPFGSIH